MCDTQTDAPFTNNPGLLGEPEIRFYAGAPLITPDGRMQGVLCVMDRVARNLNRVQQQTLRTLSHQVVTQLEVYRHIAERQQLEAALHESEERYQRITELTSFYALTIRVTADKNFTLEWATRGFEQIIGYTSQEMVERGGIITLIPSAAVADFREQWRALYEGQPCVYEYPVTARNGELHWLREHAHPVWDATGQTLNVYITGEDITERKQAEDELHRTHVLYRRAIAAADAVPYQREYATDSFTFMGEAIQQITGYSATEITPAILDRLSLETIMRGETEGLSEEDAIRRTRLGEFYRWRCDSRILTRTGEERWISDASVEMYSDHGKPSASIGILMDITDRKQVEMELKESNLRLAEALTELRQTQQQLIQQERLRAVGTMASGIAHDFNNMLAPILGFTELLLLGSKSGHSSEKELRYLQAIHMAAQNAATVISRLREFYRYRDGTEPQLPVDLHLVIEQAILLTQPHWKDQALARGTPVRIETVLQPVPIIKGSKAELQEMLTNLILNAADAVGANGKITIRVFMGPEKPGRAPASAAATDVVLEISDTGMGMDEETRRRCFEPFFSTKGLHGTGLGLAVVYGIVQRHQGRIEIDSVLGQGTTFRIYLPIPLETLEFTPQPISQTARPLHVLVVDDDPIVRDVVVEYLAYEAHSTETAANGAEGLEKFHTGHFDLVITDRAMPKLNGDGLAAAIKAVASDTPIILLTGFGEFMNADGELPRGVDYIMSKPLTLEDLQQTIGLAMGKFS
ncbi:MAG: PAS domain S-box protein [Chloroflexi bacterium]|nr:PAS domain S-box protein [Chloroflexota bacterium]